MQLNGLFFLALVTAGGWGCGSEGSEEDGSGTAGTSAGSSAAGAGGAAAGTGGLAGSTASGGTAGGAADPLACTPGFTAKEVSLYPYPFDNCDTIAGLEDEDDRPRDLSLPNPLGPGDTYAFSAKMNTGGGVFKIYGATEKCGEPGELLDTVEVVRGNTVICQQASPLNGTYTHLIWTWGAGAQQGDTTFCEGGACPNR